MIYSPIKPLRQFFREQGWSNSTGRRRLRDDPDFPPLVQIGVNRQGVREIDAARYQAILRKRVPIAPPKGNAWNAERARVAARTSIDVRRAKRDAKKQQAEPEAA